MKNNVVDSFVAAENNFLKTNYFIKNAKVHKISIYKILRLVFATEVYVKILEIVEADNYIEFN